MPTLHLSNLDKRHPGVSHGIAMCYREAAQVCLGRHHKPPKTFSLTHDSAKVAADADWSPPSQVLRVAWNNTIDATEAAAYCIALAAVEITNGLYAIYRAETQSGADYYLAPEGVEAEDLENLVRLEVSGIDKATPHLIATRLKQKLQQLKNGASNTPGIASVVAFDQLAVASASMP
jgi:hypothetical protein